MLERYLKKTHPNTAVLDLEELREQVGIASFPTPVEQKAPTTLGGVVGRRPPLILIGHNFAKDMRVLDVDGIDLHEYFDVIGIADTQVLAEESPNRTLPQSLSGLVLKYKFHDEKYSPRARGGRGDMISRSLTRDAKLSGYY